MSLTRQIAHNTLIQAVGKIGGTVFGLIAISLITRYLGQTGFGQYTTVMTYLQFFGILVDFGLTLVTIQMISQPNADEERITSNIFTLRFISAFLFLGIAPILVLFLPYDPVIKRGVLITAASFLFIALNQVLTGLFQKKLAMNRVAFAEVFNRVVLLGLVWLAVTRDFGLMGIFLAIVISNAIQFLLLYIFSLKFVRIRFEFDPEMWLDIFRLSWPMAITIALNLIYLKTDTLILSLIKTQAEVGIYGATYKVLEVLITLPIMFAGLVLPIMTKAWMEKNETRFKYVFQKAFDVLAMVAVPLVIGTWLTSREVMVLIAGRDFAASGDVLNILIIATAVIYMGSLFGHAIVSLNKQKQTIWAYGLSAVLSVIGYLIFIPRFSYFGAAWMTVFSEALVSLAIVYVFYETTRFVPSLKIFFMSVLSSLVMAAVLIAVKFLVDTPYLALNLSIYIVSGAAVYLGLLLATKTLSSGTVKEITRLR